MIHSVRLYFVDIDKIELHHKSLHMVIVLEIENIDIDFCEFSLVGVINIDVRSRSEEHTSELQSRETISYAVFCLKKKKHATVSSLIYHKT